MGCFNIICDLTGTQIMYGDRVVLIELREAFDPYLRGGKWTRHGADPLKIYNLLQGAHQSWGSKTREILDDLREHLEEVKGRGEDGSKLERKILSFECKLDEESTPWLTFARGSYDDYGGMKEIDGAPDTHWRPYDEREKADPRMGWHAYALMHEAAFDRAIASVERWEEQEIERLSKSAESWEKSEAARFEKIKEKRSKLGAEQARYSLFLDFCSLASIEPFKLVRPYGSQGFERSDFHWHRVLTDLMNQQRESILSARGKEEEG